jgi:hypothetical protein
MEACYERLRQEYDNRIAEEEYYYEELLRMGFQDYNFQLDQYKNLSYKDIYIAESKELGTTPILYRKPEEIYEQEPSDEEQSSEEENSTPEKAIQWQEEAKPSIWNGANHKKKVPENVPEHFPELSPKDDQGPPASKHTHEEKTHWQNKEQTTGKGERYIPLPKRQKNDAEKRRRDQEWTFFVKQVHDWNMLEDKNPIAAWYNYMDARNRQRRVEPVESKSQETKSYDRIVPIEPEDDEYYNMDFTKNPAGHDKAPVPTFWDEQ